MCVCVCVCVCARARARVYACKYINQGFKHIDIILLMQSNLTILLSRN